jgi:hypothetical protein
MFTSAHLGKFERALTPGHASITNTVRYTAMSPEPFKDDLAALGVRPGLSRMQCLYIIPFILQFGLYVSPVAFSSNVVAQQWRLPYSLNPMVGVTGCVLGGQSELCHRVRSRALR